MEKKKRATVSFLRRNILYLKCRIDENPKTYIGITLEEGYLMCSQEQLKLIIGEGEVVMFKSFPAVFSRHQLEDPHDHRRSFDVCFGRRSAIRTLSTCCQTHAYFPEFLKSINAKVVPYFQPSKLA